MSRNILYITIILLISIILELVLCKEKEEKEKGYIYLPLAYRKLTNYGALIMVGCALFVRLQFGEEAVGVAIVFIICALIIKIIGLAFKRYKISLEEKELIYKPMFGFKKKIKYEKIDKLDDSSGDSLFIIVDGKKWGRIEKSAVGYKRSVKFLRNKIIEIHENK